MSEWLILCLPHEAVLTAAAQSGAAVEVPYWARMSGGRITAHGTGDSWSEQGAAPFDDAPTSPLVVALAPAADAPVRFVQYEQALPAQAAAAARIDGLAHVLGDRAEAHLVAAMPAATGQSFALCVTRHRAMTAWTGWLAAKGVAAQAIVPAALILPPPDGDGLNKAWLAGEQIMRSAGHGYASDPALDAMLAGPEPVRLVPDDELELGLAFAVQNVPLNLLSGAWAVKRGWGMDALSLRWIKRLAAALVLLTLAVPLVHGAKLMRDTARADAAVIAGAAEAGVRAADAAEAEAEIDRRMAAKSDGPLAFSVPASALYAALADAPAVSLKSLSHRGDGTLTAMIAGPRVEDVNPVLVALQARGYRITAQALAGADGQQMANITIRAVP